MEPVLPHTDLRPSTVSPESPRTPKLHLESKPFKMTPASCRRFYACPQKHVRYPQPRGVGARKRNHRHAELAGDARGFAVTFLPPG